MTEHRSQLGPAICFQAVEKSYGKQRVVEDLNLTINAGEIFVLVGASGSGKTTTLKMINRLVDPTSGALTFFGQPIKQQSINALRHRIGYVLQNSALFPHMTVLENIAVTLNACGISTKMGQPAIEKLLTDVGLDPKKYLTRYPKALSGGEQQRVGIVRALVTQPDIVLMDEPFSALDPISRDQLQSLVLDMHAKLKTTIVFVTHDMDEALRLGDRIGVMHQGHLLQVGSANQLMTQPKNQQVAKLFQQHGQTVADMLKLGFYKKTTQTALPTVTVDQSLTQLAQALLEAPDAAVIVDDHYLIDQEMYLRYMAHD